jgi:hypothetical protein
VLEKQGNSSVDRRWRKVGDDAVPRSQMVAGGRRW